MARFLLIFLFFQYAIFFISIEGSAVEPMLIADTYEFSRDEANAEDFTPSPEDSTEDADDTDDQTEPTPLEIDLRVSDEAQTLPLRPDSKVVYGKSISIYRASKSGNSISYQHVELQLPSSFNRFHGRRKRSLSRRKRQISKVNIEGIETVTLTPKQRADFDANSGMLNHDEKGEARPDNPETPPPNVFPQMVLTIDYDTYKNFGNNEGQVALYMASFFASISLQFREIRNPGVEPNILAIVIPQTADTFPNYNARINYQALQDYLRSTVVPSFPSNLQYDMVISFTWRKTLANNILGIASVGRACQRRRGHVMLADMGNYHAESSAAHEMAHSMGVTHDGQRPILIKGKAVDAACANNKDEHLMMSPTSSNTLKDHLWSQCSIAQMQTFIRKYGECLYNRPMITQQGPKTLPGQRRNRDQQCKDQNDNSYTQTSVAKIKNLNFPPAQKKLYMDVNNCKYMYCMTTQGKTLVRQSSQPPLDGSSCGSNNICISGRCVRN